MAKIPTYSTHNLLVVGSNPIGQPLTHPPANVSRSIRRYQESVEEKFQERSPSTRSALSSRERRIASATMWEGKGLPVR